MLILLTINNMYNRPHFFVSNIFVTSQRFDKYYFEFTDCCLLERKTQQNYTSTYISTPGSVLHICSILT